jgi:hypothetical protein
VEIEEGEFIPNAQTIKTDSMFDPGKGPASACCDDAAFDKHPGTHTSTPSRCSHGNEPEKKNEPRQLSKRGTKPRGAKGGTCCSLVVLRRLYEVFQQFLILITASFFVSMLTEYSFFCTNILSLQMN